VVETKYKQRRIEDGGWKRGGVIDIKNESGG